LRKELQRLFPSGTVVGFESTGCFGVVGVANVCGPAEGEILLRGTQATTEQTPKREHLLIHLDGCVYYVRIVHAGSRYGHVQFVTGEAFGPARKEGVDALIQRAWRDILRMCTPLVTSHLEEFATARPDA
jgi:hypothetical protein